MKCQLIHRGAEKPTDVEKTSVACLLKQKGDHFSQQPHTSAIPGVCLAVPSPNPPYYQLSKQVNSQAATVFQVVAPLAVAANRGRLKNIYPRTCRAQLTIIGGKCVTVHSIQDFTNFCHFFQQKQARRGLNRLDIHTHQRHQLSPSQSLTEASKRQYIPSPSAFNPKPRAGKRQLREQRWNYLQGSQERKLLKKATPKRLLAESIARFCS